jgi:hypothetical protein
MSLAVEVMHFTGKTFTSRVRACCLKSVSTVRNNFLMSTFAGPRAIRSRCSLPAIAFVCLVLVSGVAKGQASTAPEALLDRMTGRWVMTGTIGKKPTTHDVDVDWVLKREYIRIHEVSRDKDAGGENSYEAWIYVVWDTRNSEYAVMWLDNTAATNFASDGIGHAKPGGDRIPFIFMGADGSGIHTVFAYDRAKDTWSWTIDNVDKSGKSSSFAKLLLTRKK